MCSDITFLKMLQFLLFFFFFGLASSPGISGNLEKSGNFVALEKSHGKVREFREIQKSQGILMKNWGKSGNFTCVK